MVTHQYRQDIRFNSNNPILKNHIVSGNHLLPGLAYIDLIYQCLNAQQFDVYAFELRDLTIHQPLMTTGSDTLPVTVAIDSSDARLWVVSVTSANTNTDSSKNMGAAATKPVKYATAKLVPSRTAPEFSEPDLDVVNLDAPNLETRDPDKTETDTRDPDKRETDTRDISESYAICQAQGIVHTGLMKANGWVATHQNRDIICVEINPAQQQFEFIFHPGLIDGAAVATMEPSRLQASGEQGGQAPTDLFLPLYFKSFRASEPLGNRCFVTVNRASVQQSDDLSHLDMTFYNELGKPVAQLSRFTMKRVRSNVLPAQSAAEPAEPAATLHNKLQQFLTGVFAEKLNRDPAEIRPENEYYELGLNSSTLLDIVADLDAQLGLSLPPTTLFEHPSIEKLSAFIAPQLEALPALPSVLDSAVLNSSQDTQSSSDNPSPVKTISETTVPVNKAASDLEGQLCQLFRRHMSTYSPFSSELSASEFTSNSDYFVLGVPRQCWLNLERAIRLQIYPAFDRNVFFQADTIAQLAQQIADEMSQAPDHLLIQEQEQAPTQIQDLQESSDAPVVDILESLQREDIDLGQALSLIDDAVGE